MKTFFIWMIAGLSVCMNLTAQYGGRYGGRGGMGGGRRNDGNQGMRVQSQSNMKDYSQVSIIDFPVIAGITLRQKLDLSTLVTDEQKSILKLNDQKQELQVKIDHSKNQKETDKNVKKMTKLDEKIQKIHQKTDKKIQAILTNEQYREFLEKKNQIKFGTIPSLGTGFRSNPNRQDGDNQGRREDINQ